MLNGLDLFSGIGGLTRALDEWVWPRAYCENDRYCQAVLLSRMASNDLPNAPIWDDVRTLQGAFLPQIDIIYGGFPCQDISVAGLRKGLDGERTGLFREAIRIISECRPKFVFLENVPGVRKYAPTIRKELEALGYDCRDGFLSAAEVGANHIRNRWWLLAHSNGQRRGEKQISFQKCSYTAKSWNDSSQTNQWWATEPNVGRVVNGLSFRVDRIRGLGNAVVPLQAKEAFKRLCGLDG